MPKKFLSYLSSLELWDLNQVQVHLLSQPETFLTHPQKHQALQQQKFQLLQLFISIQPQNQLFHQQPGVNVINPFFIAVVE